MDFCQPLMVIKNLKVQIQNAQKQVQEIKVDALQKIFCEVAAELEA
jgi:hypothetical protein